MPSFAGPPDVTKVAATGDPAGLIKAPGFRQDRRVRFHAAEPLATLRDARANGVTALGPGRSPSRLR